MNPISPFEACRDRIRRADTNRRNMVVWWEGFWKKAYSFETEMETKTVGVVKVKTKYRSIPVDFSLQLGEVLYQLRAALDSSVYVSAIQDSGQNPPPDEKQLEFPICDTKEGFNSSYRKIRPLSDKRRAYIENVQPFNRNRNLPSHALIGDVNWLLGVLNDWARIDRHRHFHTVGVLPLNSAINVKVPDGIVVKNLMPNLPNTVVEDGHVVNRFEFSGDSGTNIFKVTLGGHVIIEPSVVEAPGPCGPMDIFTHRLQAIRDGVDHVIAELEGLTP